MRVPSNVMAFNFGSFCSGCIGKVIKVLMKKKQQNISLIYNIDILLSSVIYSLSKIVILHGLLESLNMRKCYQLLVCRVLTIKKQ